MNTFSPSLVKYQRRKTIQVKIGDLQLGSDFPIRVQSMTTTDTMDTNGSVAQILKLVDAGCELVRLTAPSINEAKNLEKIKAVLTSKGVYIPLVADIHFTPNAAEMAARIVEKVRINPGNYADKKRFDIIDYTDAEYQEEIDRIRQKFTPLIHICKEYGTALRIGTNHGSLSDRIMSRYGDTPHGMVESAMEFLRIANDEGFHNIVLSMKSSNPQVMVQAYRLLVKTMDENNFHYPLHLGVTEAGDGNDGRIKSALGIGALLEDGIGDTIRVSLTEDPEFEIPVAKDLVSRYQTRAGASIDQPVVRLKNDMPLTGLNSSETWNPFQYTKVKSKALLNIGGDQVPRIFADFSNRTTIEPSDLASIGYQFDAVNDKWKMSDLGADYIYLGSLQAEFMLPMGMAAIYDATTWNKLTQKMGAYPIFEAEQLTQGAIFSSGLNFVRILTHQINEAFIHQINAIPQAVLVLQSQAKAQLMDFRNAIFYLKQQGFDGPIVMNHVSDLSFEQVMLHSASDFGTLLIDGMGDGLMVSAVQCTSQQVNELAFGICQAARARISKTEYISCPSCGRTLFDLQETTAKIRKVTDHLKGVKIAIMGCIVNGPGEMADADYGYVGSGPGKITLYKGKEVVKKGVHSDSAVHELIEIIKQNGDWTEPGL
jgi:(E)-4-hydroxy-3-methylbut-2-enyl-diphosphate synthase